MELFHSPPLYFFNNRIIVSIDPRSRSFSKLNGKASYKDLLNVIKEKDKLIGKLQSENEEKDFIELNAIQEKSVV